MALGVGAIATLIFACFILYGGLLYFVLIAAGRDPIMMLPDPLRGFFMVPWNRYGTILVVAIVLIIPALTSEGVEEDGYEEDGPSSDEVLTWDPSVSDYLDEGDNETYAYDTGGYVMEAWFNLTWTDEEPPLGMSNDPDSFRLEVTMPNGEEESREGSNPQGDEGSIELEFIVDGDIGGEWIIEVTMVEAGDSSDPFGLLTEEDTGNDYDLEIWFKYME